jgi:hypothetical protein
MPVRVACVLICLVAVAPTLRAQTCNEAMTINPDRPDLTNSPQLVAPGSLQIETGVMQRRQDAENHDFSSLIVTTRIGVYDWLEAQFGSDGLDVETNMGERTTSVNGKAGAKVRLLRDSKQQERFSILPQVQYGVDHWSYALTAMWGADIADITPCAHIHLDANYSVGAIGSERGHRHFAQQFVSGSMSVTLPRPWNAYFEAFGYSREDAGGPAIAGIDTGVMYTIGTRMEFDGGIGWKGIGGETQTIMAFGGFSVAFGHADAAKRGRSLFRLPSREKGVRPLFAAFLLHEL